MARQGNTTALGMGYAWQQDRKRAIAAMPQGTPCPLCGRPMYREAVRNHDGRALHYDHVIPRALGGHDGPRRLTCSTCNMRAGQRLRTQMYRGKRIRRTAYTRW